MNFSLRVKSAPALVIRRMRPPTMWADGGGGGEEGDGGGDGSGARRLSKRRILHNGGITSGEIFKTLPITCKTISYKI